MKEKNIRLLRGVLLAAGLFCIGIGAFRGEAQELLVKGINLFLECVGIGEEENRTAAVGPDWIYGSDKWILAGISDRKDLPGTGEGGLRAGA